MSRVEIQSNLGKLIADYDDFGENNPLVLLFPGRGGNRSGASKRIAEYLHEKNISTLRVDPFGHGESDGELIDITISTVRDSVLASLEYARKNQNIQR